MISLAHELFMSEYYTLTLIDVVVRVLVYRGKRGGADNP